jgi:hypothetical protein
LAKNSPGLKIAKMLFSSLLGVVNYKNLNSKKSELKKI